MADQHADVIVVGAGMSGLTSAHALRYVWGDERSVLILEGSDSVGGRIQTVAWADSRSPGSTVNLNVGAHWIAGDCPTHPLRPLLGPAALEACQVTNFEAAGVPVIAEDGQLLDYDWEPLLSAFDQLKTLTPTPHTSTLAALRDVGWRPRTAVDYAAQWYCIDFEWGTAAAQTSLFHTVPSPHYVAYGSDDQRLMSTAGGSKDLLAPMLNSIPKDSIKLNHKVTCISDTGERIRVTTTGPDDEQHVYTARTVVLTASLEVLANKAIQFSPELPDSKQEVLQRYKGSMMAHYEVIIMEFPAVFWPQTQPYTCTLYAGTPHMAIHDLVPHYGLPILEFHFAGTDAAQIAAQPMEQTRDELMAVMRRMHGAGIPEPTRVLGTAWCNNPLTRGAFSVRPLDMTDAEYDILAAPAYEGRLLFAGDGLHAEQNGYMHGAYLSGLAAAETITRNFTEQEQHKEDDRASRNRPTGFNGLSVPGVPVSG